MRSDLLRRARSRRAGWALLLAALLPIGMAPAAAAAPAGPVRSGPSPLPTITPVVGKPAPAVTARPSRVAAAASKPAPAVSWPAAGTVRASLPAGAPVAVRAGGLPVTIRTVAPAAGSTAATTGVVVEAMDRAAAAKAGVAGLLLRVTTGSAVRLSVDYSSFAAGFGADWGSRLRLLRVADGKDVTATNDPATHQLTGTIPAAAAPTVLALAAGASGSTGDFTATSLSPAASWQVSAQSGDFSWSYPITGPAVPGGLAPDLGISYSSGAIDGRVAATNNQPSWVGDGDELWGGYIERGYRPCADDGVSTSGDECWAADNATLVWNGGATALVRDDTTGAWHPAQDDGSTLERLTGATNGDNDGEYWRLTVQDGTQYYFGLNRLPGWVTGKPTTNSASTVPVYGNGAGEPCHAATFATSSCAQAWRWNLDYVVDPHSDAMAYYYTQESNRYLSTSGSVGYVRGGTLARVDYGFRAGQAYTVQAPAQVVFTLADRCKTVGATCTPTVANAANFPDTPVDQICAATCTASQKAPTFFSTKRLARVDTQILSGTTYAPVDRWTLGQAWPDPGDGTSAGLFLSSITHSGMHGGQTDVPAVTFDGIAMQNRVDGLEGWPPLNKYRVSSIASGTGGRLEINYAPQECVRTALPADQATNTKRCFAAWWTPPGEAAQLDWFHRYVVAQTLDRDLVGGGRFTETDYSYPAAGAAWHYQDADEVTAPTKRTWSSWRGYATVTVKTGAGDDGPVLTTEHRFYRGMDGDKLTTGTRTATVSDSQGGSHPDSDGLAGFELETRTLDGAAEVSGEIDDPVRTRTAAHAHDGRTLAAYLIRTAAQRGRSTLDAGVRTTRTDLTYDAHGNVATIDDHGDLATTADDRCTRTAYASDAARHMFGYPSSSATVTVACAGTPVFPRDAVADTRAYYGGSPTLGALPGAGDVTRVESAKSYTGSTPAYVTTATSTVDGFGRPLTATDALNRTSKTSYTETGGLTTSTVSTDPLTFATTTTLDPARGQPTSTVDANGRRTDLAYDPLGRLASVWLPGHAKASFPSTPNESWTYALSATAAAAVTSNALGPNGNYISTYALYDGLLRPRQTQAAAVVGGGRILTDTTYDTRGLSAKSNAAYVAAGLPAPALLQVDDNQVPGQTATGFDGAGRATASMFRAFGAEQWRTSSGYHGDHVDVTPPSGGTATTTFADARGRTTKLMQYRGALPTGTADTTSYTWTGADQPATMTDPAGNKWTWTYDPLGRTVAATDPDKGATTSTYDDAGQLLSATDARGTTLAYSYDVLGRRAGEFLGSTAGTKLAGWTYDTVLGGKGLPASATRIAGGQSYTTAIAGYGTDGQPSGQSVTIPATETGLAGTYNYRMLYQVDGQLGQLVLPITPGLSNEGLTYTFDSLGNQTTLQAGATTYVTGADYTALGQLARTTLSSGGATAFLSSSYDLPTGRLSGTKVELGGNPVPTSDAHYAYDPAGDVTSIADTSDTQCFGYDGQRRLTQAWTPAGGSCATAPTAAGLGGPAPYWQNYTYSPVGDRTGLVSHAAAGNTTTTYAYPAAGAAHPHAVSSGTVAGPGVARTDTYGYDATGNMTTRTVAGAARTLGWDAEGRLASVSGAATGSDIYDADGDRLIRKDAAGSTLYLPDGVEVHVDAAGANATSTRYYSFGGDTVAMRTPAGLSFLGSDPHGTASVAVNSVTGAATVRRMDPFGNPRGSVPAWPGDHGFVDGSADTATGLTHLGARDYDPGLGRFVSVDPLLDPTDPQSIGGYGYADGNPVTNADPDGTLCTNGPDGMCRTPSGHNIPTPGVSEQGRQPSHYTRPSGPLPPAPATAPVVHHHSCGAWCVVRASIRPAVRAAGFDPDTVVGVADAVVNTVYEPVMHYALCGDIFDDCAAAGHIPMSVHIPGADHSSTGYKVGEVVGVLSTLAVPGGGEISIAAKAEDAAKAVVTVARTAKATIASRAAASATSAVRTAARACANSFTPATPVLMADGTSKPIHDVKVGDQVRATDPETGETAARPVQTLIQHSGPHTMVDVRLADGSTLHATDGHPIWDATTGHFTDAIALRVGDQLLTAGGALAAITATQVHIQSLTAYNLEIADIHTYYAGPTPLLVHNSCDGVAGAGGSSAADRSALGYATSSAKLDHIFAAKHNFDPLVDQFGSREAVVQQFLDGLRGQTPESGTFQQQIVVGGQKVIVRGAVIDGVTKIGTAFTP